MIREGREREYKKHKMSKKYRLVGLIVLLSLVWNLRAVNAESFNLGQSTHDYIAMYEEWVPAGAKLMHVEARGIDSQDQQAAVLWCAYNRVLDERYPDDLVEVITQPGQFASIAGVQPDDELMRLSADVFFRFVAEQYGETDVGRTLPSTYLYFNGDGLCNHFREEYASTGRWDWSYDTVYGEEGE